MFGLPGNHPLSRAAEQLTREHTRSTDTGTGTEAPLLSLLERAIPSDTSGAYGGGSTRTGAPLDVAALALWDEISASVNANWPGRNRPEPRYRDAHLITRLSTWVSVAPVRDQGHLLEMCEYWISRIREHLEPSKRVTLRGQACPACKCVTYPSTDEDGGTVLSPSLLAHLEPQLHIECRACGEHWAGELEINLEFSTSVPQA